MRSRYARAAAGSASNDLRADACSRSIPAASRRPAGSARRRRRPSGSGRRSRRRSCSACRCGSRGRPSSTSSFVMHWPSTPFSWNERRSAGMSSQPQRRGRPVTEPNSLPRLRERRADVVGQLGGEGTGADARRVRLHDAEHVVEHPRADAAAGRRGAGDAVRARHVRIGAVVDVEQRALRAFEQQRFAARARLAGSARRRRRPSARSRGASASSSSRIGANGSAVALEIVRRA